MTDHAARAGVVTRPDERCPTSCWPPVVAAPALAIRKPAVAIFTLDDYVEAGIMSRLQAEALRNGVSSRLFDLGLGRRGARLCRGVVIQRSISTLTSLDRAW